MFSKTLKINKNLQFKLDSRRFFLKYFLSILLLCLCQLLQNYAINKSVKIK